MKKTRALLVSALFSFVYAYTIACTPVDASEAKSAQEHHNLTIVPSEAATTYSALTQHGPKGRIMHAARKYAGTTYHQKSWNCSDYTRQVFGEAVGVWMIDWDDQQIGYGYHPRHRRRGDLVFFDENGRNDWDGPVTHVSVYAGKVNGIPYVWHNSSYYGKVVKSPLTWILRNDGKQAYVPHYTRRIR